MLDYVNVAVSLAVTIWHYLYLFIYFRNAIHVHFTDRPNRVGEENVQAVISLKSHETSLFIA